MQIIFFGSSPLSNVVLQRLVDKKVDVALVVAKPDKESGRGQKLSPNPVKVLATKNNLTVVTDLNLLEIKPGQIGLVAAYGKIIPQKILNIFNDQIYNIHPSLLPKYRGASPLQFQILDNLSETGVTVIKLDAEMDHGPILAQKSLPLDKNDTWLTLGNKLFTIGADLFLESIKKEALTTEQLHDQATYTRMLTRQDGFIPWNEFATQVNAKTEKLEQMLKAYASWPGVWTTLPDGKRLKLLSLAPKIEVQIEGKTSQSWPIVI